MTDDLILKMLDAQARSIAARCDGEEAFKGIATVHDIGTGESKLGVSLPPLLKRIYLEIANGGCMLGPGTSGMPGGYDNGDQAVKRILRQ